MGDRWHTCYVDWNLVITGVVGVAGILGTLWGSRYQSKAAAHESLLAHKRDVYGRLVAAGIEVEYGYSRTANPSSSDEVREIREYLYRTSVEVHSLVQAVDFLGIPEISGAANGLGEAHRSLIDSGSAGRLEQFQKALYALRAACQKDLLLSSYNQNHLFGSR